MIMCKRGLATLPYNGHSNVLVYLFGNLVISEKNKRDSNDLFFSMLNLDLQVFWPYGIERWSSSPPSPSPSSLDITNIITITITIIIFTTTTITNIITIIITTIITTTQHHHVTTVCVLQSEILFLNSTINNGVYRSGFASSQEAYDSAVVILFEALEKVSLASICQKSQQNLTGACI
jgi:hypothetical protein